ncbi:MAG: PorT protein [Flavobacteriaceae bacterium]|nr:MAG: PorT protein [Flavobacteriaceae bacterium]
MTKNLLFLLVILLGFQSSYSQKKVIEHLQDWDNQKMYWGFYLGVNKKDYKISYKMDDVYIRSEATPGFNVGLIGDLKLHNNISLRLEPGLSSNTKKLFFTHIPGGEKDSVRTLNSTYLRIPLLLKFSTNRFRNIRPYVVGGVSYDYNFSSNEDNPDDNFEGEFRMKKNNFTYEIGVGIDIYLYYFVFSPSIRGVFAINNELVRDHTANSPWTGPIDYFGTRGVFLKLAFH